MLDGSFNPRVNGSVSVLVVQPDGKVLVHGNFTELGGQPCTNLGRLNADGTLDPTFAPRLVESSLRVDCLAVQADGKILVGGHFTSLCGQPRHNLGRLNPDGTLDEEFAPSVGPESMPGGYPCPLVRALAVQADGKILVGGCFTELAGGWRGNLGRLNPDGTLDDDFQANTDGEVMSLALHYDETILAGGSFTTVRGRPRSHLARVWPDGTVDEWFDPEPDGNVRALAVQADGSILVGGRFDSVAGWPCTNIVRLTDNGWLDNTFRSWAGPSRVESLVPQADGKVLVGGAFTWLAGAPRNGLGRLNRDGTLDDTFNPEPLPGDWGRPFCFALQPDGAVIVGGDFSSLAGQPCEFVGRLNATHPASQHLSYSPGGPGFITWERDGTCPEVWRTTFEVSTNGADWIPLGSGWRMMPQTWWLDCDPLPLDGVVRARGYTANSLVEDYAPQFWMTQPASQSRQVGESVTFSVTALSSMPLYFYWWKDGQGIAGATTASLTLTNLRLLDAGGYSVVILSPPGWIRAISDVAWLTVQSGALDSSFNPEVGGTDYRHVYCLALQADGKILLGGAFSTLNGQTRGNLGRLNPDGTLDSAFDGGAYGQVSSLAVQADGKILAGGLFTSLGGQPQSYLGRLNGDGTLDTTFNPAANGYVRSLALQADGKILVGGYFTTMTGQPRDRIARLNTDGTLDSTFNPGANNGVTSLVVQPDGKILVGGTFTTLGGQPRNWIGRLNPDGTLDSTFDPRASGAVSACALQADGMIVLGGDFEVLGGQPRARIARLNADGTLDISFDPGANGWVKSLALQADGKILVGGEFTALGGQVCHRIGRLNANGTPDNSFDAAVTGYVVALVVQADGKVLAGGFFDWLAGEQRMNLGRLNATHPATRSFSYNGAIITWLRGGTSPEVWRTTFEFSTDLTTWSLLGAGTRVPGGWNLGELPLLPFGQVRARGYTVGGNHYGSSWFVESTLAVDPNTPPQILSTDGSFGFRTNQFGFNLAGLIGQTVVVEASTNLTSWTPLTTNTLSTPTLYFSDPSASSLPLRFYRARLR